MSSPERVQTTLNFIESDKVPAHMNATKWVVKRLKEALHVSTDRDLLKALHIDIYDTRGIDLSSGTNPKYIGPENIGIPKNWAGNIEQLWGLKLVEMDTGAGKVNTLNEFPLKAATSLQELEEFTWPDPDWFDYSIIRNDLQKWSDFSILCSGCSVFQHATYVRGMDSLLMDMKTNPDLANFLLDKFTDFYYQYYKRIFEQAGDLIDIFALADDLGMQNGLIIRPQMFEDFIAPRIKLMADLAHKFDIKLLLHSCGSIRKIIPRLIELGVDILDPIQPEAGNMDPVEIKKEFGDEICLRGGSSALKILTRGTVEDAERETQRILKYLAPGGGYILAAGHPVLQVDMPVDNIIAMYETGYRFGFYE